MPNVGSRPDGCPCGDAREVGRGYTGGKIERRRASPKSEGYMAAKIGNDW